MDRLLINNEQKEEASGGVSESSGTFTPVPRDGADATKYDTTVASARYLKVGSLVYIDVFLSLKSVGTPVSSFVITELPFPSNVSTYNSIGINRFFESNLTESVLSRLACYVLGSQIYFEEIDSGTLITNVEFNENGSGQPLGRIAISGVYRIEP